MLRYFVRLSLKSIAATPAISALAVGAIGLGIAVPTMMISIYHLFAQDPIPHKSGVLYNVRLDNWNPNSEHFDIRPGDPPKQMAYRDMAAILPSPIPRYRSGVGAARVFVFPHDERLRPYETTVRLCHADFFPMFDVPFRFGGGWSREVDENVEQVVVLSREANQKLFGGRDSVGERVRLGSGEFTVIGVLAHFRPMPKFYDVINDPAGKPHEFFIPFDLLRTGDIGLVRTGDTDSWGNCAGGDAMYDTCEVNWIQYWVELDDETTAAEYRSYLDSYVMQQKELGRFPRPLNNRVTPLMEWIRVRGLVSPETVAMAIISLLFLAVCALNLTGLLLAKFLSKSPIVGVHRALGASRAHVFVQRLLECEVIGLIGGCVGALLTWGGMTLIDRWITEIGRPQGMLVIDSYALTVALVLSLLAGVLSGLYPAWRACRIAPAVQLKLG